MERRNKIVFLILVLAQGLHSIEEYIGRLWEVFPPTKLVISLVSGNLENSFIIINVSLFIFGIWCYLVPVKREYSFSHGLVWFWIVLEMINGIGHPVWALYERAYVPGMATALLLLIISVYLSRNLLKITSRTVNE
jgi:hypothetical protein